MRNAVAGFGGRFATLAVGMLMAPYLLDRLGTDRFAVWALVSVVTGSLGLLDVSVRVPLIKFLAEGDAARQSAIATNGLVFLLLVAGVMAALFGAASGYVTGWLAVPLPLQAEATLAFGLGVAGLAVGTALSLFPAICDAHQRMDVTNGLGIAALIGGALLTVGLVERGYGVPGAAAAQCASVAGFHLACIVAARRVAPHVAISPALLSGAWLARLMRFGGHVHAGTGCGVVAREFDKLLLARGAGLGFTAAYELGTKLVAGGATLVSALSAALLPAASRLAAGGQHDRLLALHRLSLRYLSLLSVPVFVFVAGHAGALVQGWTGTRIPLAATTVVLLAAGYLCVSLGSGMVRIAQGMGRQRLQTEQALVQLVANVACSLVLYRLLGPFGAPLGTSIALALGTLVLTIRLHRALGEPAWPLLRASVVPPALCATLALAAIWMAAPSLDVPGRLVLWPLAIRGVAFAAAFAACCLLTRTIDPSEIRSLAGLLAPRRLAGQPGGGR